MRILICGGGVIGVSIAYFLACRGIAATVIEGTGVACAASGKSGGSSPSTGATGPRSNRSPAGVLRCTLG